MIRTLHRWLPSKLSQSRKSNRKSPVLRVETLEERLTPAVYANPDFQTLHHSKTYDWTGSGVLGNDSTDYSPATLTASLNSVTPSGVANVTVFSGGRVQVQSKAGQINGDLSLAPAYVGDIAIAYTATNKNTPAESAGSYYTVAVTNTAPTVTSTALHFSTPTNTTKQVYATSTTGLVSQAGWYDADTVAFGDSATVVRPSGSTYVAWPQGTPVTTGAGGSLYVSNNGQFTYVPATGYTGWDSFEYAIWDKAANGFSATVTVHMKVGSTAATTTSLSSSQSSSVYGEPVTLTATVASSGSPTTPTGGTVTFKDGGTTIGTGTVNSSGVATAVVTGIAVGSRTLTAVYGGNGAFAGSTSSGLGHTVGQASTTTTLTATGIGGRTQYGSNVTFTATVAAVSPSAGAPSGTVQFTVNGGTPVNVTMTGNTATLTLTSPKVDDYSVVATYQASTNYSSSTTNLTHQVVDSFYPIPIYKRPDETCPPQATVVETADGSYPAAPGTTSGSGVELATGTVSVKSSSMSSSPSGELWGQTLSWSSSGGYATDQNFGNGWNKSQAPQLVQVSGNDTIAVVLNGQTSLYFDKQSGGNYLPRFAGQEKFAYSSGSDKFTLTTSTGDVLTFGSFSTGLSAARRGQFESVANASGSTTTVTAWNSSGEIAETQTANGGNVDSYLQAFVSSGVNAGKTSSVTLRRSTNGGSSWTTVRSTEYAYYDGTTSAGNAGDLELVTVKDETGTAVKNEYYRYFDAGEANGFKGAMKLALLGQAYDHYSTAVGNPLTASDSSLASYANIQFQYDAAGRVAQQTLSGEGCSACSGGQGTYAFTYATNSGYSTSGDQYNQWKTKSTETFDDGSVRTSYTNAYGQVMLSVLTEAGSSPRQWIDFTKYDSAGRTLYHASPSAVTGFNESYNDLVNFVGGNATYLADSAGLFQVYAYGSSTTATDSTQGDALGYVKSMALRHGETGSDILQSSMLYISRTTSDAVTYHVTSSTRYRNTDGTGGQTTTIAYTFASGSQQIASTTTTLPTVSTAQNGPNTAATMTTVNDAFGRPVWMKDAAGVMSYLAYDAKTGAVVKSIQDVNTASTSDFANLPSGWSTPSGAGFHLVSTSVVDSQGRTTKSVDPMGHVTYTVYDDANHEVRTYAGWNTTTNRPTGPITVYCDDRARGYTEMLTMSATPSLNGSNEPTGTESISNIQSLSRSYRNAAQQTTHTDDYFDLTGVTYSTAANIGTLNTNYYRTTMDYGKLGQVNRTVSPAGTITRSEIDARGNVVSVWVGTDDTPATGFWSTTNLTGTNMVKVSETMYDNGVAGDGNATRTTLFPTDTTDQRVTETYFDWRNRPVATKSGVETSESTSVNRPISYAEYDNLGEVVASEMYDGDGVTVTSTSGVPNRPSSSLLRAKSVMTYDELGRAYKTETFAVNPSSGSVSSYALTSQVWFDLRGLTLKTTRPGGMAMKTAYDSLGRATTTYATDGGGDSGYADADDVTGDTVLSQTDYTYDANFNVIATTTAERLASGTGNGALTSSNARLSYSAAYFDLLDRTTDSVFVGTNGGSAWTRPGSVPSRSDSVRVSSVEYDDAGRAWKTSDGKAIESVSYFDLLGRVTLTYQNYLSMPIAPLPSENVKTSYEYGPAGMTKLIAWQSGTIGQQTEYVYGVTGTIYSNDIVGATKWPDKTTGTSSSSEQETVTVNALGEVVTSTDRNGSVHTITRDILGRVVSDAVTTLASGVDGSVRRIDTAYDSQGNAYLVTSYDAATGGSIVNQVQRAYNGLGQITDEWQQVGAAVNTSTSPRVQYVWSSLDANNRSRLVAMVYPSGYTVDYNYASGLDSDISRLSSISDAGGTLESYGYLGAGSILVRTNGAGVVHTTTLDDLGRVASVSAVKGSTTLDGYGYTYDRNSNRLTRSNATNSSFNEAYSYDGTNQLTGFTRGSDSKDWGFDALGNRTSVTTNGGTPDTWTANAQNQITGINGATTPTYDSNGNMTGDEQGCTLVYDAWNRLVQVKNGSTVLKAYTYDGGNRKITEDDGTTVTQLVYSAAWQVLEEKVGSSYMNRYVWSVVYVDALVMRDDGTQRVWAIQDANWNVTALVDDSGNVLERFGYDDPYGMVTAYDATWNVLSGGSSLGWVITFQGMRYDETTGNFYQRMRWYSPTLGKWFAIDPLRFESGGTNFYAFEFNNSVNTVDPTGLEPKTLTKMFAGGTADFTYDKYDQKDADFVFLVGHVATAFPQMGDLKLSKEESAARAEAAKAVNPMPGLGAARTIGMTASFKANLACGENAQDYQWVQKWRRGYAAFFPFKDAEVPDALKFPEGWQLDHNFERGKLSFDDKPGQFLAMKKMEIGTDVITDRITGDATIKRPDLSAIELQNLKVFSDHRVAISFEFRTELKRKGVTVATFTWGFIVSSESQQVPGKKDEFTYSGKVKIGEIK